jgi:putative ABC transport system substrate-binding protein
MFNPDTASSSGSYHLPLLDVAARTLKVEPITALVRSEAEIEAIITSLGREPGGGLVFVPDNFITLHRASIVSLAARNNVPAVYFASYFVGGGGLLSYGPDIVDIFRRSASYVDRILKGEKPADLPVQTPNKYELVINLKTAKALGLTIPETLLATADEVIQ